MKKEIMARLEELRNIIRAQKSLAVAFSGGIDSSLIAKVAFEQLGERALAITVDSPILPRRELRLAQQRAREIGISHIVVQHSELENPEFVKNPENRCYYCKKESEKIVLKAARSRGFHSIAFGVNATDHTEHRPGLKAMRESESLLPLEEAGIGKDIIPLLARKAGLSDPGQPSTTCLASRIPYGDPIDAQKLRRVEKSEDFLYHLGIRICRVRLHGDIARIEVESGDLETILTHRLDIIQHFRKLGFSYITADLEGYRSGSMDESLKKGLLS